MKTIAMTLAATLLLFAYGCKKDETVKEPEVVNLTGTWDATNYQCPSGTFHDEVVEITHVGTDISAVKTVGDPCVPAGNTTFIGTWDNETLTAAITWTTGLPSNPASSTASGSLVYNKENGKLYSESTTSESIVFTKR